MPPKKKPVKKKTRKSRPTQQQTQRQVVNIKFGDDKKRRRRAPQRRPQNMMNSFMSQQSALTNHMINAFNPPPTPNYERQLQQIQTNLNSVLNNQNITDANPAHNFIDEKISSRNNGLGQINPATNQELRDARTSFFTPDAVADALPEEEGKQAEEISTQTEEPSTNEVISGEGPGGWYGSLRRQQQMAELKRLRKQIGQKITGINNIGTEVKLIEEINKAVQIANQMERADE
tara:strand:+ start:837 stop:1535 length:699 start_codon:yes stop_codon:yes gene_type:complete